MPTVNGNKFKGNKVKKGARGRKSVQGECDPTTDQYARVVCMEGGNHMQVLSLNSPNKQTIRAKIKGIHHKKVWFKKDDYIVITVDGNVAEVQCKVLDTEIKRVRNEFEKMEGVRGDAIFDVNDFVSDDEDEEKDNIAQPNRDFNIDDI